MLAEQASIAGRLQEAARIALAAQPDVSVWPQIAGQPCAGPVGAAKHLRFHLDLLRLAGLDDLSDQRVLDVGSGFGLGLVVFALLGAEAVHGIEYMPGVVTAVERYLPALPVDLSSRIQNVQGDAAAMPFPDQSFDILFSIEAISHYLDPTAFLREAGRVLRPGGILLISDGNNGANPKVVRHTHEIWRAFEEGAPGTQVHGHTVGRSYRETRRALIADAHPELSADALDLLARNTAGYSSDATLRAAEQYRRDGTTPRHPYRDGQLATSPEGTAMERLFNPRELAREIEGHGFRTEVRGYWGGAGGQPMVRRINRALTGLSRITLRTAGAFRIVARRA